MQMALGWVVLYARNCAPVYSFGVHSLDNRHKESHLFSRVEIGLFAGLVFTLRAPNRLRLAVSETQTKVVSDGQRCGNQKGAGNTRLHVQRKQGISRKTKTWYVLIYLVFLYVRFLRLSEVFEKRHEGRASRPAVW